MPSRMIDPDRGVMPPAMAAISVVLPQPFLPSKPTIDWGRIVFLLVDAGLLNRQESDTIDDFRDGYDFQEAFVRDYQPGLEALKDEPGTE